MKLFRKFIAGPRKFLFWFLLCVPILMGLVGYTRLPPSWLAPWISGFSGNLIAGIFQGVMFLFLALYLDGQTELKIDRIQTLSEKSEAALRKREEAIEEQQRILEFENILRNDSWYDVRFPDIKTSTNTLGLEYTIETVKDTSNGLPLKYETESVSLFIVKIRGPAQLEVLNDERKREYEYSPIKENHYYFCRYLNSFWHMGSQSPFTQYRFYPSGKVGPAEWGISANTFMENFFNPKEGLTEISILYLNEEGKQLARGQTGGVDAYKILQDKDKRPYLCINDSLPRKIYYTNPSGTYTDSGWFPVIEKMRGFAAGDKLKNVQDNIFAKLSELRIEAPKTPWYETDEYKYEIPT